MSRPSVQSPQMAFALMQLTRVLLCLESSGSRDLRSTSSWRSGLGATSQLPAPRSRS